MRGSHSSKGQSFIQIGDGGLAASFRGRGGSVPEKGILGMDGCLPEAARRAARGEG